MAKKVKVSNINEEIDATGQESEVKAAKWVIEKENEREKEDQAVLDAEKEILGKRQKFKFMDYKRTLAQMMARALFETPMPQGWRNHVSVTDKGIVCVVWDPTGQPYVRAFAPVNDSKYDITAVEKVLESAWVQVERWESAQGKTESGIILPDGSSKQVSGSSSGATGEGTRTPTKPS